jgi:kynurenine formamidase
MDKRVQFDFEITFTNGGGIQGQDFRLDIDGNDISDQEIADYIVKDMRLLMVGSIKILHKKIITESQKRTSSNDTYPTLIDLSHIIKNGLITYKGLPAPIICDYLSREESKKRYDAGTTFQIGKIEMVTNTGTYIDCPFHRYEDGKDLSQIDLESCAGIAGIVIRVDYKETLAIDASFFRGKELQNRAVLVHTGWDQHWNTDQYFDNHPYLTADAALYLVQSGAKLVGIDSVNIDDTRGGARPVHTTLLGSQVLIVEHLCHLEQVTEQNFTFSAIPPKFKGAGTFPVRAFAKQQ